MALYCRAVDCGIPARKSFKALPVAKPVKVKLPRGSALLRRVVHNWRWSAPKRMLCLCLFQIAVSLNWSVASLRYFGAMSVKGVNPLIEIFGSPQSRGLFEMPAISTGCSFPA